MLSSYVVKIFKNKNIFFGLLFLLLFVTGCGAQDKEIYKDSWKEDVLVAQECGLSGLTCCFDKEKKCEFGLECCFDPSNKDKGYCSEACESGKLNKYCRRDEPRCDGSAACVNGYCVECGITGNPCCAENKCLNQIRDNDLHAECMSNVCTLCGYAGEQPCLGEFKCAKGNLNSDNLCLKCGVLNQPCCAGENSCEKGLKCQLGFCS